MFVGWYFYLIFQKNRAILSVSGYFMTKKILLPLSPGGGAVRPNGQAIKKKELPLGERDCEVEFVFLRSWFIELIEH